MEICSTCRFWDRDGQDDDGRRRCLRPRSPDARLRLSAADEWDLELTTAPDFGCLDWKPVGTGVPILYRRAGWVSPDGSRLDDGRFDRQWPAPDYSIDASAVIERSVSKPTRPGWGMTSGRDDPGVCIKVSAVGLAALDQAWAECVQEALAAFVEHQAR